MKQGPIIRARARQLHQQVSSFLSIRTNGYEDGMLPNVIIDYVVLRNLGEDLEGFGNEQEPERRQGEHPNQVRTSNPTRTRVFGYFGAVFTKNDA